MNRPPTQFTIWRMMIVVVLIAVPPAIATWVIRTINSLDQSLHDFYGPEGALQRRIQEYHGTANSQADSK
jgi:hypothetical protein